MSMVRWDPFRDLEDVSSRLNRLLSQRSGGSREGDTMFFADWVPAVDIQEADGEYLIKADLPEVTKEDVSVDIHDGVLTLQGERRMEKEEHGKRFQKIERAYGKFMRRFSVPADVDQQRVLAEFKDGVLRVHLPKTAPVQPKAVQVKIV